jgi:hypothetical protein
VVKGRSVPEAALSTCGKVSCIGRPTQDHLSKMVFFQSAALLFGLGFPLAFFGTVAVGGWTAGCVVLGLTGGTALVATAFTTGELGIAVTPAAPSPTTTKGAQKVGCASRGSPCSMSATIDSDAAPRTGQWTYQQPYHSGSS